MRTVSQPVVSVDVAPRRVCAVVPCFDRPDDLERLLGDLEQGRTPGVTLDVIVVDNASTTPIETDASLLRLSRNTGGSGGFNAGIEAALRTDCDLVWLIDSDARVEDDTLPTLLRTLDAHDDAVAVGPAILEPGTDTPHEVGGVVDRRTGRFGPLTPFPGEVTPVEYVAACCVLVKREAIERTGRMPDLFLNADDVTWCLRLGESGTILVDPAARAWHPRFDRAQHFQRYYVSRNAFAPIDALGLGWRVRARRGVHELGRAVVQTMLGRPDLARLHLLGLKDASKGETTGPSAHDLGVCPKPIGGLPPMHDGARVWIAPELRDRFEPTSVPDRSLVSRLVSPGADLAIVPARGRPGDVLRAKRIIGVDGDRLDERTIDRWRAMTGAFGVLCRGVVPVLRLACRERPPTCPPPITSPAPPPACAGDHARTALSLAIVVLSFNRKDALRRTLTHLGDRSRVIVVENGSSDGSATMVRDEFPHVDLVELTENLGVEGFNRGVEQSTEDVVLILDDDAWPDPDALVRAMRHLEEDEHLGAVTFHRRHPRTGESEWPFESVRTPKRRWPDMGCANLVRREAWHRVGGYESGYFLYRNDTDLALSLLGAGYDILYDPTIQAWHDSPIAKKKTSRWLHRSTRNWVWMCRRHGRGWTRLKSIVMGWLWAHRLAGAHPHRQWSALRGFFEGVTSAPPALPVETDGSALRRLVELKRRLRAGRDPGDT